MKVNRVAGANANFNRSTGRGVPVRDPQAAARRRQAEVVSGAIGLQDMPEDVLKKIASGLSVREAAAALAAPISVFDALEAIENPALIRKLNKWVGPARALTLLQGRTARLAKRTSLRLPEPRYITGIDSRGNPASEQSLRGEDAQKEAALQAVVWPLLRDATNL